jgi:hypothetical protein
MASAIPESFFASRADVPADIFMWQEPAPCGGKPTQHSIVQTAVAESVLKGATPPNRTRIRIAAMKARAM